MLILSYFIRNPTKIWLLTDLPKRVIYTYVHFDSSVELFLASISAQDHLSYKFLGYNINFQRTKVRSKQRNDKHCFRNTESADQIALLKFKFIKKKHAFSKLEIEKAKFLLVITNKK